MSATPARRLAHRVLRRVSDEGAYADRAFRGEADRLGLEGRERALAQRLAYGAIQRRRTLDAVVERCASRSVSQIDPGALDVLRLGAYQLLFLDGVPARAAVAESVEIAKAEIPRAAGFVNAVLRRVAREGGAMLEAMGEEGPLEAALRHSQPDWIAELLWDALGPEEALELLAAFNRPAESALRVNTLRSDREAVGSALAEACYEASPDPDLPEALVVEGRFDVHGSDLFAAGAVMPQSRGSMTVARAAAPAPGARVLDLCAAPGAKATHLAALMDGEGLVVALERHPGRAEALRDNAARLGADAVEVRTGDAAEPQPDAPFDLVLLDPPCSDLGTLQSRPDARWRKEPATVRELAALQARLLEAACEQVGPGGVLVYSTCTISPEENERQVERLIARREDFALDDLSAAFPGFAHPGDPRLLRILPHRHGTDGFFVARMRRSA